MALFILKIIGMVLFIVVFFGLCIFLHEMGHLLVALWRGLYVERFSVGFGKKLWGITRNNVEYIVSALPFGGYVALPQLEPTEEPSGRDGQKLPPAKPLDRILTAAAGPLANVLFGFFLALFIWWFGIYRPAPADHCDVSSVLAESAESEAGLRVGDRIVKVNGQSFTGGWKQISESITVSTGEVSLSLLRDGQPLVIRYRPRPNPDPRFEGLGYPTFRVRTPTVVHFTMPGGAASKAGLQARDILLEVDGRPVEDSADFIETVRQSAGKPLALRIERNGKSLTISGLRAEAKPTDDGQTVYQIGAVLDAPVILIHPNPWQQFMEVVTRTTKTLRSLWVGIFSPKDSLVKPKHMSGPVGILNMLWAMLQYGGLREGLSFIILITFSLAFFNLLPIPVLDGGHIVFAFLEMITRKRIPPKAAAAIQTGFAVLLITFMLYITYYDLKRLKNRFEPKPDPVEAATPEEPPPPPPLPAESN